MSKIPQPSPSKRQEEQRAHHGIREEQAAGSLLLARAGIIDRIPQEHRTRCPGQLREHFLLAGPSRRTRLGRGGTFRSNHPDAAPSRFASFFSHPGTGSVSLDDASKSVPTTQQMNPSHTGDRVDSRSERDGKRGAHHEDDVVHHALVGEHGLQLRGSIAQTARFHQIDPAGVRERLGRGQKAHEHRTHEAQRDRQLKQHGDQQDCATGQSDARGGHNNRALTALVDFLRRTRGGIETGETQPPTQPSPP